MKSKRTTSDPLSRICEALEFVALTMLREEGLEVHDRAVRIFTGEPPRMAESPHVPGRLTRGRAVDEG